ncbi:AzlC family ABC transporter permease [Streptomyces sp. ACA25]|uniref:AzlC family ABC transporter permease n=1 Tax=Streptomyces sp. ACA25 TaxID=3022596 RepID=UPI0023075E37|nr:AzlC family ABC transporter permease [Streptomyces sp. ACA25]MDB1087772.1 AzlC family ABC transporter permease [Streptomyces sp. ACA25]
MRKRRISDIGPGTAARDGARSKVVRDALGIGVATGTYGLSFGALATSAGLSLSQTCALSLLMFTGASQFAFVGVVAAGGAPLAGAATAALLGTRNALYGLHLSPLLRVRGVKRLGGAHLVIDESAAMSLNAASRPLSRLGFWTAGLAVFACWNLATLLGALGAHLLSDPAVFGLDVVAPAAFVALMAPRLRSGEAWRAAVLGAGVALVLLPVTPAGVPVLLAALAVTGLAAWSVRGERRPSGRQAGGHPHGAAAEEDR